MNETTQPRRGSILPLLSTVTFLGFIDTNLLIPVLALYAAELGAGVGVIGLIVGLYSITNTPANLFWGWLIDKIGYKRPLMVSLAGDAISMFLYAVSGSPLSLALTRVLHGVAGASIGPATMSAIAEDSYHARQGRQGRGMGFYGISIGAATLAGFGLSGLIASRLGFAAVFYFGAALPVIGVLLSLRLPAYHHAHAAKTAERGHGWQTARSLLRRRPLVGAYTAIFAQYFTFGGVVTLLPLYVKELGLEAFHVGMSMAAFAVVFIVMQMPVGAISDRVGRLVPAGAGLALGAVALFLMPSLNTFPLLLAAMAAYGVAYGAIFPSVSALVAEQTTPQERGTATGIFHGLLTAGVAIGALAMGWTGEVWGVTTGLLTSAAVMAAALLAVSAVTRYRA